jgi:phosphoribosylanthranilate isomerase
MWVKICGTTNLEDALAAVDAGADALGFVFADSPRRVDPGTAGEITRAVPERIEKIGVFVNETAERIRVIVEKGGLSGVQLHGYGTLDVPITLEAARGAPRELQVILVLPILRSGEIGEGLFHFGNADRVLFDTAVEKKRGGSGQTWNWENGKAFLEIVSDHVKVIIAGGLTPANVADAIRTLHPWGVDVVSGVEREPGKKDHAKVRAFVEAAKSVNL